MAKTIKAFFILKAPCASTMRLILLLSLLVLRKEVCSGLIPLSGGGSVRSRRKLDSVGFLGEENAVSGTYSYDIAGLQYAKPQKVDHDSEDVNSPAPTPSQLPTVSSSSSAASSYLKKYDYLKGLPKTKAPTPSKRKGKDTLPPIAPLPPISKGTPLPRPPSPVPPIDGLSPTTAPSTNDDDDDEEPRQGTEEVQKEEETSSSQGFSGSAEPAESSENDYSGSLARTLPVAAFQYFTNSVERPDRTDYEALREQTKYLFDTIYRTEYEDNQETDFMGVDVKEYGILASRLVKYDVNVYFRKDLVIPSLFEVQSIVEEGLNSFNGQYIPLYLDLLEEMASPVFSTTREIHFFSNAEALVSAQEQAKEEEGGPSVNVAAIVAPTAVLLLLLGAAIYYHFRYVRQREGRILIQQEHDDPRDVEKIEAVKGDCTMSMDESTGFWSRSQGSHCDGDSCSASSSSYEEVEVTEDERSEFEEITLEGDEEVVDMKNHVGEIKKSYVATNIAEINVRKSDPPVECSSDNPPFSTSPPGLGEQTNDPPTQACAAAAASQSITTRSLTKSPLSSISFPFPLITNSPSQTDPTIGPSQSSSPNSPPIWSNPSLRPVRPKQEHDIREMAMRMSSDDDKSVLTIDSQSSKTPEFLKKFKAMGLATVPRTFNATEIHDDEQSVLTIDSRSSTTPEFLKKFKEMGLKRYKN